MRRRELLTATAAGAAMGAIGVSGSSRALEPNVSGDDDHAWFSSLLSRIAAPVLELMASGRLHSDFPVEVSPNGDGRDQRVVYLECFARTIAGAAPWLALDSPGADRSERRRLREYALQSYEYSVDPDREDYLDWDLGHGQMLVDSAYYTQAMLRAPFLWEQQSATTRQRIVKVIKSLRRVVPPYTNWLLFAAMNEAFLMSVGEQYDPVRLDLAIRKFLEWYAGDGWFNDGQQFAFDYYNSYVIHPMMLDILEVMTEHEAYFWNGSIGEELETQRKRSQRYAEHLERMISPTGTYPPVGRSITYRTAAFQPLAQLALKGQLPETLSPGRVRAALRAVHEAIFSNPSNFCPDGFLRIGFAGANSEIGDWYSNNGSMYITTTGFLHLGRPASDVFWTAPTEDWTQKRAFRGGPFSKDYPVTY